jgi:hypothetical protein
VVLGLMALGRHDVLAHVVKLAEEQKGGAFVDARLPFYRLHALQWFLIGIARGAIEFPATLAPFADQIVDWTLKDQSHVLIRQFAARAALALLKRGELQDRDSLKERLAQGNVSPFPIVESKSHERIRSNKEDDSTVSDDDRHYFGIDIGPYWYAPLGNVFAVAQTEIQAEALKVIRADYGTRMSGVSGSFMQKTTRLIRMDRTRGLIRSISIILITR